LSKLGFQVIAATGRPQEADYLKSLGAAEILDRAELAGAPKALAKERWACGVDSVGSNTLANLLAMTKYGGAIAACGLAGGMDLPTSVAPTSCAAFRCWNRFSQCPQPLRRGRQLARDLDKAKLAAITREVDSRTG
jgi:acrylyl-CoA reductase (NADPH)